MTVDRCKSRGSSEATGTVAQNMQICIGDPKLVMKMMPCMRIAMICQSRFTAPLLLSLALRNEFGNAHWTEVSSELATYVTIAMRLNRAVLPCHVLMPSYLCS